MGDRPPQASAFEVDVAGLPADGPALDLLARMALAARRCGCRVDLRGVSPELRELIELAGLTETLRPG